MYDIVLDLASMGILRICVHMYQYAAYSEYYTWVSVPFTMLFALCTVSTSTQVDTTS